MRVEPCEPWELIMHLGWAGEAIIYLDVRVCLLFFLPKLVVDPLGPTVNGVCQVSRLQLLAR